MYLIRGLVLEGVGSVMELYFSVSEGDNVRVEGLYDEAEIKASKVIVDN